jgi:two-component system chemotaxis response regulator CheB
MAAPPEIIAIVASTGGPAALVTIIQQLPPDFAIPIVIVQHISADFVDSLRRWISRISPLPVTQAQSGARPEPGSIYLAPGGKHLRLTRSHCFELDENPGTAYHVPAGDILLESVGESYGKHAIGVVLTGIGDDGARGLRTMCDMGAFTIAQDEATSAVYGMPKAAHALGAARRVLPLTEIAPTLIRLSGIKKSKL